MPGTDALLVADGLTVVLGTMTVFGFVAAVAGLMEARRSSKRLRQMERTMGSKVQGAVVKAMAQVLGDRPRARASAASTAIGDRAAYEGAGYTEHVGSSSDLDGGRLPLAAREEASRAAGASPPRTSVPRVTPPGVEAIGEVEAPMAGGLTLLLGQNQKPSGAELVIMRWDGFDPVLAAHVENRTGASFECVGRDAAGMTFRTVDREGAHLVAVDLFWSGGQQFERTVADADLTELADYFQVPAWASPTPAPRAT